MPIIFVSHASSDRAFVEVLKSHLDGGGLGTRDYFISSIDGTIPLGSRDIEKIYSAMEASSIFIEIITPSFLKRSRCLQEVGFISALCRNAKKIDPDGYPLEVLPMVIPPLTPDEVFRDLDRVQAPVMNSDKALRTFSNQLRSATERCQVNVNGNEWIEAQTTFVQSWIELCDALVPQHIGQHIEASLATGGALSEEELEFLGSDGSLLKSYCKDLPADTLRRLGRQYSNAGRPNIAIDIARLISTSTVEKFGVIREAFEVNDADDAITLALTDSDVFELGMGLSNVYKAKFCVLMMKRGHDKVIVEVALTVDNQAERVKVISGFIDRLDLRGDRSQEGMERTRRLMNSFNEHYRGIIYRHADDHDVPRDWFV
jgi:hypothetical protein